MSFNQTSYPQTVVELFLLNATSQPQHIAVEEADRSITYQALHEKAIRLREALPAIAVSEPIAALVAAPSIDYVATLVGILQAGWTCLPVDVKTSTIYNETLVAEAGCSVLIADDTLPSLFASAVPRIAIANPVQRHRSAAETSGVTVRGDTRACLFFTSGSTGRPKGVEVLHRGIARLVLDRSTVPLTPTDRIAQCSSVAFDGSTFEIWGALANGATLVIPPRWPMSPREFLAFVREKHVTVLVITAALFVLLVRDAPEIFDQVRIVVAGGDVVPLQTVRTVASRAPSLLLVNGYGPTEDTTMSCQHRVVPQDWLSRSRIPIGRPIAGTHVCVLNEDQEPVETGTPGELFLGGDGVARGYLNNPVETAARFRNLTVKGEARRWYATGDLVVETEGGILEFLGRRDSQVKIRGNRIELRAVEHAILESPDVAEVAVLVDSSTADDKNLVAFIVPARHSATEDLGVSVRRHLRTKWPVAYSPSRIEVMTELPLTQNGKVDLKLLRDHLVVPTQPEAGLRGRQ
jgi:amino acid adenylation domain-containing protein